MFYSRALVAANDKLKENYDRHKDYSARLEQAKARQEALRFEVETSKAAYEHYRDTLGETDSATIAAKANLERYQEEHADATAEVTKLEGQVKALQKTMQNSADAASKAATDLNNAKAAARETDAEIKKLTEELYRMKSAWTQAGTTLTNFSKKCGTLSKALTKAGKTLTTTVTTPIVGLGTTAVKASMDFESSFAYVRKTVNGTEAWKENTALAQKSSIIYGTTASKLKNLKNTALMFAQRIGDHMSGDFPVLKPGLNGISWSGNVTSIVISPRWRYL